MKACSFSCLGWALHRTNDVLLQVLTSSWVPFAKGRGFLRDPRWKYEEIQALCSSGWSWGWCGCGLLGFLDLRQWVVRRQPWSLRVCAAFRPRCLWQILEYRTKVPRRFEIVLLLLGLCLFRRWAHGWCPTIWQCGRLGYRRLLFRVRLQNYQSWWQTRKFYFLPPTQHRPENDWNRELLPRYWCCICWLQ